jgi:phosphate transport system permease protein
MQNLLKWWKGGSPWIWLNAGAVAISIVAVVSLLLLIMVRGLGHFWPGDILDLTYNDPEQGEQRLVGELVRKEEVNLEHFGLVDKNAQSPIIERWLIKTGNRELSADFRWIDQPHIEAVNRPESLIVLEREEWGNFYGELRAVEEKGSVVAEGESAWTVFLERVERASLLREQITQLEKNEMGSINYQLEMLRMERKKLVLERAETPEALAELSAEEARLTREFNVYMAQLQTLNEAIKRDSATFQVMDAQVVELPLEKIIGGLKPNQMSAIEKTGQYVVAFWRFLTEDPREANTEGGVFPAIFGTIMMVIVMSIIVTPIGIVAAVYLREYASQGIVTRIVRIAVNNLAGVPSIVYGVFGLGFFVYFLGGNIDKLFFPEAAPAPFLGTSGLLWASLTLALLTLPVVIVSTEEGLTRIPRNLREGSLALGATKAETLWKVVLPMASPSIMTGLILAVARAAGEVAPLMLVGVVKLAPTLPLDENFPFLHMERKFMHLGFHIYDVGFQSPNVEAAQPLVYATAFLLVLIIVILNLSAILLRNRLSEKYRGVST